MCMARIITEQVPSVAMSLVWSSFAPVEKGSSARESGILETVAKDLRVRGAESVEICVADLTELAKHQTIISHAVAQWDGLDAAIIAHGLPDQLACERDPAALRSAIETNYVN